MEGDVVSLQDIFVLDGMHMNRQGKVEGALRPTGIRPRYADRFEAFGVSEYRIAPPEVPILR